MKYLLLFSVAFVIIFSGCDSPQSENAVNVSTDATDKTSDLVADNIPVSINVDSLIQVHNDSVLVLAKKYLNKKINLPPVIIPAKLDSATTSKFSELAKSTGGELTLLINSKSLTEKIFSIIKKNSTDYADVLLLMDKTGSMEDDIKNVQLGLKQVIDAFKTHKDIRVAMALYGDNNVDGTDWFSFQNFETDYDELKNFIDSIKVTGGGDTPESVYDGFFETMNHDFWRSDSKRIVVLIGDAPPLEDSLTKHHLLDVVNHSKADNIAMNFYPIVVSPESEIVIEEEDSEPVRLVEMIYPNPTSDVAQIRFKTSDDYTIQVFNSSGKNVFSQKISGMEWKHDFSSYGSGAFLVRVINPDYDFDVQRLIVQTR